MAGISQDWQWATTVGKIYDTASSGYTHWAMPFLDCWMVAVDYCFQSVGVECHNIVDTF